MNLVLFGPPGAGKGTQSGFVAEEFQLTHISSGDLLRAAIKDGTPLGTEAKKFLDSGNLVPDSLVINLIKEAKKKNTSEGMLLDGFPRTAAQADALDELLIAAREPLKKAVFIEVPRDVLIQRLVGRRVCSQCGTAFHVTLQPSRVDHVCDVCGGNLEHRSDDQPDVIVHRLDVYQQSTEPLKDYYKNTGKLAVVDGVGEPTVVFSRISQAIRN